MFIGDPKHIERLTNLGLEIKEEGFDSSYGALSALITQETLAVEPVMLTLPEGEGNA